MLPEEILREMTDEEKAALVSGTDFMYTNAIPRLNVPAMRMSDGPHGLRVQSEGGDNGVTGSAPATAFPTAACTACGWNTENLRAMGAAIAAEAKHYGVHVVLGPGANIKRNPLAGRNFEYFSEDPLLAGKLAAAEAEGIQGEGVAVSVKHFALNNAENYRFMGNSVADERAIREIYLKVFEIIVREAKPATMMCAYNQINGEYCSQNGWLLNDVLRGEWGFDGLVMTDWGAMHDRVQALKAGLDLEMPGDAAICRRRILDALKDGTLGREALDNACRNILRVIDCYARAFPDTAPHFEEHDALACKIAEDCAVLMKNDGTLPLDEGGTFAVVGDLFEKMRYQGAGSSMINPTKLTAPKDAFDAMGISYIFARGYAENATDPDAGMIAEACKVSQNADTVLAFLGLTDYTESEGCDRETMSLPANQLALVDALLAAGKRVVVVLFGGSPVELPFSDRVSAILNMYLPGQSGGRACADLLFGMANPAGKLAETWPVSYADVPFGDAFSRSAIEVYKESVFVGYRYYATVKKPVRYPFGFGLSYTTFALSGMQLKEEGENFLVSCTVKNTGARDGAEVVELYVSAPQEGAYKPLRELRAFTKVYLKAGEERRVTLTVPQKQLRYFDLTKRAWVLQGGIYRFQLCSDCEHILSECAIEVAGAPAVQSGYSAAQLSSVTDEMFERMSGRTIPKPLPPKPLHLNSRFTDMQQTFLGRILYNAVLGVAKKQMKAAKKLPEGAERDNKIKGAMFLRRILESNSIITLSMSGAKGFPYNFAEGFVALANGKILRGIRCFCLKIKVPPLPKDRT